MWWQFPSLEPTLNYGVVIIGNNNQNSRGSGKLYANARPIFERPKRVKFCMYSSLFNNMLGM